MSRDVKRYAQGRRKSQTIGRALSTLLARTSNVSPVVFYFLFYWLFARLALALARDARDRYVIKLLHLKPTSDRETK